MVVNRILFKSVGVAQVATQEGDELGLFAEFKLSWDPTVVAYVFSDLR